MKRGFFLTGLLCFILFIGLVSFGQSGSGLVKDILEETNDFRKKQDKPALEMRDDLNAIAQKHSANMAAGRVAFGHDGFESRQKEAAAKLKAIRAFAENVAYGATSGKEVVKLWKNSAGHRRNMLGNYKYIGIGAATDASGRIYYTQVFAN
ncbi:MAG: CAP domain-containing protein [Chitinophagaceae bacterium]